MALHYSPGACLSLSSHGLKADSSKLGQQNQVLKHLDLSVLRTTTRHGLSLSSHGLKAGSSRLGQQQNQVQKHLDLSVLRTTRHGQAGCTSWRRPVSRAVSSLEEDVSSLTGPQQSTGQQWQRREILRSVALILLGSGVIGTAPRALADYAVIGPAPLVEALQRGISRVKAPAVLRLPFHDAFTYDPITGTGGMNGSILFELDRDESVGLKRAIKPLRLVKEKLEPQLTVSWADLIALGGAVAVASCGGPTIPVRVGRLDSGSPDPPGQMPPETLSAPAVKEAFQAKGFSVRETVALLGAHTIGGKGFGDPDVFDNAYYRMLLERPWEKKGGDSMAAMVGLPSDRAMAGDEDALRWIRAYAEDQALFFEDFSAAYQKMVDLGARWA